MASGGGQTWKCLFPPKTSARSPSPESRPGGQQRQEPF